VVDRDLLIRRGFVFEFYSHQRHEGGGVVFFCLDVGYRIISEGKIKVLRSKEGLGIFM